MRMIDPKTITDAVARLCVQANRHLPCDVQRAITAARVAEDWPPAAGVLDDIVENYTLAGTKEVPICQDTGVACVFVDIGRDVHIEGDLAAAVDAGVRHGYAEGYLRKSVVADPLRRQNTGDNTPAMLYVRFVAGDKVAVTVAPKGFGSENMSRIAMLSPSDGEAGVLDFVVRTVREAGPNPCPPVVVGVGIGGTFDKCALLAKRALLRGLDEPNTDAYYAGLEAEMLRRINETGVGPQGFGGRTTALGVAIEVMPTHIAGLPCAVNINCHVARHASEVL